MWYTDNAYLQKENNIMMAMKKQNLASKIYSYNIIVNSYWNETFFYHFLMYSVHTDKHDTK